VVQHLNDIGNVMNLETNAHSFYDDLRWGIEAIDDNGEVRFNHNSFSLLISSKDQISIPKGPSHRRPWPGIHFVEGRG